MGRLLLYEELYDSPFRSATRSVAFVCEKFEKGLRMRG